MARAGFSFVHASDLHLDRPVSGLGEAHVALGELAIDAPYAAGKRVFDLAVGQRVDFVLLAGDVLHPIAGGARPWAWLVDQFDRLGREGIAVYWSAGRSECDAPWPPGVTLPANVHVFTSERIERRTHLRGGQPLCDILGRGFDERHTLTQHDFAARDDSPCTIALAYGSIESDAALSPRIEYWALGGRHGRQTLDARGALVHHCGSPQARRASETGPRGCTLVEVGDSPPARTQFVPTDSVRFARETVKVPPAADSQAALQLLTDRAKNLIETAPGCQLVVEWLIDGDETLSSQVRCGGFGEELRTRLIAEFGRGVPGLWTSSVRAVPTAVAAAAFDEDSVRGEFLRTVRHFAEHPEAPLELDGLIAERYRSGTLAAGLRLAEPTDRRRILDEASHLSADLLVSQGSRS